MMIRSLDVANLADEQRPTGIWAAALLHALARDEAAGRRPLRLTEPKLDTWTSLPGTSHERRLRDASVRGCCGHPSGPVRSVNVRRGNPSRAAPGVRGGLVDPHRRSRSR